MLSQFLYYGGAGVLVLRLAFAYVLIKHGWGKVKNPKGTAEWFSSMGFKPGKLAAFATIIVEFFGGILVAVGLFTQYVAIAAIGEFLVILIWKIARGNPMVGEYGYEIDLMMFGTAVALFFLGAGIYSLDKFLYVGSII